MSEKNVIRLQFSAFTFHIEIVVDLTDVILNNFECLLETFLLET